MEMLKKQEHLNKFEKCNSSTFEIQDLSKLMFRDQN